MDGFEGFLARFRERHPDVSEVEVKALWEHCQRAKDDPDYDVIRVPKMMVIAPELPASEMMSLRAGIDEERCDPDYSVVLSYDNKS